MHLLAHELLFGVCGYLGHLLLRILLEVYHIIFLVDLRWKLDVLGCWSREVLDALARAMEAPIDAFLLLLA